MPRTDLPYPDVIFFIRHAQSEGNLLTREERLMHPVGTSHYKLTDLGRQQAALTAEWVRRRKVVPYRVFSSYYARTNETAEIVFPGFKIRHDPRLAERDRGLEHVTAPSEIDKVLPGYIEYSKRSGIYHARPLMGKSFADMEVELRSWLMDMRLRYPGKEIAVVTHAYALLLLQKILEGWDIPEFERRYRENEFVANASVLAYCNEQGVVSGCHKLVHVPERDYFVPWEGKLAASKSIA